MVEARHGVAHCDGGYITNVAVEDLLSGKGMIAMHYDGEPIGGHFVWTATRRGGSRTPSIGRSWNGWRLGTTGCVSCTRSHARDLRAGPGERGGSTARCSDAGFPPSARPQVFICGPTSLVESVGQRLLELGHEPDRIKTERFGASGG